MPMLKGFLLNVTRASLLTLPFIWRWKWVLRLRGAGWERLMMARQAVAEV